MQTDNETWSQGRPAADRKGLPELCRDRCKEEATGPNGQTCTPESKREKQREKGKRSDLATRSAGNYQERH